MKQNIIFMAILGILLGVAFVSGAFVGFKLRRPPQPVKPQVDTVWLPDTARLTDSKPAGSVVATLPIARPAEPKNEQDTNLLANCADTLHNSDPVADTKALPDSAQVVIPIEQRTYEGEHYRAVVQGFRPELVSIDIRLPEIAAPKRKWWSVTVGPQVGYGFTPSGWQPYAGIGVSVGISF